MNSGPHEFHIRMSSEVVWWLLAAPVAIRGRPALNKATGGLFVCWCGVFAPRRFVMEDLLSGCAGVAIDRTQRLLYIQAVWMLWGREVLGTSVNACSATSLSDSMLVPHNAVACFEVEYKRTHSLVPKLRCTPSVCTLPVC